MRAPRFTTRTFARPLGRMVAAMPSWTRLGLHLPFAILTALYRHCAKATPTAPCLSSAQHLWFRNSLHISIELPHFIKGRIHQDLENKLGEDARDQ